MLTFPVISTHNIVNKFEQENDIGVNIIGYEKGSGKEVIIVQGLYPRRLTAMRTRRVVDLLLISDDEK